MMERRKKDFAEQGFLLLEQLIPLEDVDQILRSLTAIQRSKTRAGHRHIHRETESIQQALENPKVKSVLNEVLPGAFPVRSILFDKNAEANWGVPWHQDLTICVEEKIELPGFSAWSEKDGLIHVQPPTSILEAMVTLRLNLDACDITNGPLEVLRGSHRHGRLRSDQVRESSAKECPVSCCSSKGGAVIMRPLLLHRSQPARNPTHRRVLHVEFAAGPLPGNLKWVV